MDSKEALDAVNKDGLSLMQKLAGTKWGGVIWIASLVVALVLGAFASRL